MTEQDSPPPATPRAEEQPKRVFTVRDEIKDKLSVYASADKHPHRLQREIIQKQCEDFLVEMFEGAPSAPEEPSQEAARSASPQFTVVYVEGHDGKPVAAPCCLSGCQYNEALKDAIYHRDCRPNRRKAEAAIADAKAMNDKWADERVRAEKAEAFLEREGYRACDIPACNCGSWHQHRARPEMPEWHFPSDDKEKDGDDR